jgi:hypothetical protein
LLRYAVLKAPRKVRKGGEAAEPLLLAVGLQFWLSARYFGYRLAILTAGSLFVMSKYKRTNFS